MFAQCVPNSCVQACAEGNIKDLKSAFEAGGSVNATNGVTVSCFECAACDPIIDYVVEAVSLASCATTMTASWLQYGNSPLLRAAIEGHDSIVQLLINKKARVDFQNAVRRAQWVVLDSVPNCSMETQP